MKKSQITLFLLIPLILLASFILVFSVSKTITESYSQDKADLIFSDTMGKESLTKYIERCIKTTTEQAVKKISLQGGFLFKNQNGSMIDWEIPSLEEDGKTIAYQIYQPNKNNVEQNKFYPCYTAKAYVPPIMKGQYCHENYHHLLPYYIFGSTGEPTKGINPDLCSAYNYSKAGYTCFCQECIGFSIEAQLEHYISKNLPNCINFSNFPDYEISSGNISTDLTIENKGITAKVNYPLIINSKGQSSKTEIKEFEVNLPIRLKKVYESARKIISQEINNVSFDFLSDSYDFDVPYLSYHIRPHPDESSFIFVINDSQSLIDGKNYFFQFAVENRRPALDYFNPDNCYVDGEYFHVCVVEGQKINLQPIAYDPDDQPLFYSYSGWKSDYDSLWTTTSSNPEPHQEIFDINYNYWHNSDPYLETKRSASYKTKNTDIGKHNLTISAIDSFGLKDQQTVKIFVDDRPSTYFTGHSLYPEIPLDTASIEDPFFLNASSTSDVFGSSLQYKWEDKTTGQSWDYDYENEVIETSFDQPSTHTFELRAKSSNSVLGQYQKEISVLECLPHRQDSAPFPFQYYNNDPYPNLEQSLNPLMANHTCCSDGTDGGAYGQVKSGHLCYHLIDYGCVFHFDVADSRHIDPAGILSSAIQSGQISNPLTQTSDSPYKDLFRREIKVYCGSSGNKCDGPIEVEITPAGECPSQCVYQYKDPKEEYIDIGCQ